MSVAPQAPLQQTMGGELHQVLNAHNQVYIKETVNLVETATCSMCNERNKYWGFANAADSKLEFASYKEIKEGNPNNKPIREQFAVFYAEENSKCLERTCCCNNHGFTLQFYDPKTGMQLETIERPGCLSGKFCLPCCSCHECCIEEMHVYKSGAVGDAGSVVGERIFTASQSNCCKKPCGVDILVTGNGAVEPDMKVETPIFFGGCKSLFLGDDFPITDKSGPVGHLSKPPPASVGACIKEICTDADEYSVQFAGNAQGEQKLAMITAAFQADFMLFSHDKGPIYCEDCYNCDIACTICNCYMCGVFRPCTVRSRYYRQTVCWPSKIFPCLRCLPGCGQGSESGLG
jgi:hypothetical protein